MIIIEQLKKVKDTRSHINQVYPVIEVAFVVITAMLCGQNKWTDIKDFGEGNIYWLREYFPYENGLPTRHNIAAIMTSIVPETLREKWSVVKSVVAVVRDRSVKGKGSYETSHCICTDHL